LQGFQLWVNLPQKDKMTKPRYQDVLAKDIPEISHGNGVVVKVIAGSVHDVSGPVQELMAMPFYLDVRVDAGKEFALPIPPEYNTCLYVIEGAVGASKLDQIGYTKNQILLFSREGDTVYLNAGVSGARFLLMSGKPLGEPVAWYGPIVMNTQEELEQAAYELRVGSFIKEEAQASL